jgi:3-hydroxyacyl-CoA dehydrogenase
LFECVEAAQLLPLEAGLAMEATLRAELRQGERAQGLIRTVTLEERQAAPVNLPDMITVQGDGPLAFGLVLSLLAKGFQVQVAEQRDGGAAILMRQLGVAFQAQAKRGRLDDGGARRMMRQVSGGESPAFLAQAGLVIEASEINEDSVPVLIKRLRRATSAETPVMITSGMALAAGDLHDHLGGRVIGLALHAAVQRVGLAELAVADPDQAALAQAVGLMRRLERRVVLCPPVNGLIAGRLKAAMLGAAEWCVKQGVAPDEVDRALGWSRGPFQQADAEGLARQVTRFAALGQSEGFGGLFEAFLSKGREGRATGRGILSYGEHGAAGDFDETARTITDQWRGGKSGDALRPESVRRRVWTALFSAGMQLLDEGVAHEAGDVDLAALEALGLPRASGGPMKAGELRGLLKIKGELERWQGDAAGLWRGSDRLSAMIKNGRGFGF